ncbi:TonB-dependent receptor plug domain-containing protein [Sinomicrobium soli]|uniref:TonB-dependent receptor plug domain-containing protein n=1 Tax=Sinomicrobium sp. N-1-3-6 TaxID=2219864 RepID=UPI000DCDB18D|nr:TonB-dependent receptor plug domain-containing protein [Sinomicrobium sp. N-1-3-6]RAV29153.1 TonB-dependent receptor [Sinomicrobium sp. N-1-3-6]
MKKSMTYNAIGLCGILIWLCVQPVLAQKDTVSLNEVSVFGYSPVKTANRQAFNVKAIDAAKLHNSASDIAHVLDRVPGARLRESGGLGSDFSFSLNGFSGKRVRFFLDGIPMDHFGAAFQINNIPVNLARRVEVYKGVVPVWLGSDALGGAVNIITETRMKNYLDVSYSYGSFNTHKTNINAAITSKNGFTVLLNAFQNYSDNNYKVTVDAADIHTGKYYPGTRLRRFHDTYHNETAITQFGFTDKKWADQFLLGITLGKYYREIQTGARMVAVYGAWHSRGDIVMPTLKYRKKDLFTKGLDVMVNANYNFGREQNIDTVNARYGWLGDSITYRGHGGERWYQHYVYRNNAANASATLTYAAGEKHYFALNNVFSRFDRKGYNKVSPYDRAYTVPQKSSKNILGFSYQYKPSGIWNVSVFGKYLYQHAGTTLIETTIENPRDTLYTDVAARRNKLGYGIAASYFIHPRLQVKASYEKTNRLPESEDIFGDLINREANWDIKPESSDNINIGFHYTRPVSDGHLLYFSATGIYYHTNDFILYTFSPNQNRTMARNMGSVSNTGIESELRYSYKQAFTLGASVTYQSIRDRQKYLEDPLTGMVFENDNYNETLANLPYFFGNADASLFFGDVFDTRDKLTVGYNLFYMHHFYLYSPNQGNTASKFGVPEQLAHDASITYTLQDGRYNISLECKNFTDRKLYDNFSLQKPGRAFYVKLRYFIH